MYKVLKKITSFFAGIIAIFISMHFNAQAECKKEDINYYLEKGFTTEQITALCSENEITIGNKTTEDIYQSFSDEYADEQDDQYLRKMRIERQVFFKSALGAQNVVLSRDLLIFNLYECAREGLAKPGSDFNKEGCAVVKTTVKLSEVEVSEKVFKEKVVFGVKSILVKGNVKTEIIGGMDGLDPYDAKVLNNKVLGRLRQHKGEALIPIKQGLNFQYALDTFKEIVAFHKQLANEALGKDLGGKLEIPEFTKEDNNYITENKENKENKLKLSNDEDASDDGTIVFDDMNTSSSKESTSNNQIPDDVFN